MNLSYILQMRDFCMLLLSGFVGGAVFSIISSPYFIRNKPIFKIPIDFAFTLLLTITFIGLINRINMGEFRLFLLIAYLLGIILELLTLGKLFAKGYKWVYNRLVILYKNIKESKFSKVIFK